MNENLKVHRQSHHTVSMCGEVAIVGAQYETAAFLFIRNYSGTWEEAEKLSGSLIGMTASDKFGYYVGISGSYAIISADAEDGGDGDPITNTGTVCIYEP